MLIKNIFFSSKKMIFIKLKLCTMHTQNGFDYNKTFAVQRYFCYVLVKYKLKFQRQHKNSKKSALQGPVTGVLFTNLGQE